MNFWGAGMVRETIKFSCRSDALLFDEHLLRFLNYCETRPDIEQSCLFSTCEQDDRHHIRIIETDNTRMLGKLLNYLKVSNFSLPVSGFTSHAND